MREFVNRQDSLLFVHIRNLEGHVNGPGAKMLARVILGMDII